MIDRNGLPRLPCIRSVCVLIGLDWAKPMMQPYVLSQHVTCSCISHTYLLFFHILNIAQDFSDCLFFLSLSFCLCLLCLWHLSVNPLQPGTLFILVLLHPLILLYLIFGSVMMMPLRHSRRTFLDEVFIRNAKSFCRTLPTPTFPLSFTIGDGSHCVTSRSPVLSCLSRSFTPTCTGLIVQYLFSSLAFEVRAFLSHRNLLRMCFGSLGKEFPNCPSCEHLRTVSRDKLMSAFCERPLFGVSVCLHHINLLLKVLDS